MATAATSLLGLALPVTGELSGTWGDTVNNSLTALLDTAVAGTTTLSADSDVTLSTTTLAANQARQAVILWTAGGTVTRNITAPAQSKPYTVINKTSNTQSIVLRGAGPTTGVTIVAGEKCVAAWDGADFVKISNTLGAGAFTTLSATGVATFSAGTAALPAITTTGDTNTGIFFPAADQVAITTGGAQRAVVDASGNVGIGTSSPASDARLTLSSPNTESYVMLARSNSGVFDVAIGNNGGSIAFKGGADSGTVAGLSEFARIDSSGNLGVGTTSPAAKLQISSSSGGDTSGLRITRTDAGGGDWRIWSTATANGEGGGKLIFGTGSNYMTLDGSGNLGVGTTSPADTLDVKGTGNFNNTTGTYVGFAYNGTNRGYIGTANAIISGGAITDLGLLSVANMTFGTGASSLERMRIDSSGNLLVGTTSALGNAKTTVSYAGASGFAGIATYNFQGSGGSAAMSFFTGSTSYGSITTSTSGTAYNTSSDYRLKEDIQPLTGALTKVAQLKPVTYKWKADGSDGEGFIAHELQAVVPDCVTGEKDAVDADGNPVYQGIDTSFLVATLTAAIQEQQSLITSLTARITALEST
jgi:hypothetical protein